MTGPAVAVLALRPRLIAQTYRVTGVWADAEEAVDEAVSRWAATRPGSVDDPAGWLAVTATRLAVDRLRRRTREPYVGAWLPEPVDLDPLPDDAVVDAAEFRYAVLAAFEELTPVERGALVLREGFGLRYAEIGEALGATEATARQWVRRARVALAEARCGSARGGSGADGSVGGAAADVAGRVVDAVVRGDLDAVIALLADDVCVRSDGGGRVNSILRDVVGPRKVAYFLVASARAGDVDFATTRVNGEDAVAVRSRGVVRVITLGCDGGRMRRAYFQCNPDKLARVPLPEGWIDPTRE